MAKRPTDIWHQTLPSSRVTKKGIVILPDGIPIEVGDAEALVLRAESQQVVGAPGAAGDSLAVLALITKVSRSSATNHKKNH